MTHRPARYPNRSECGALLRSQEPLNPTVEFATCRQNGQMDGVILSSMPARACLPARSSMIPLPRCRAAAGRDRGDRHAPAERPGERPARGDPGDPAAAAARRPLRATSGPPLPRAYLTVRYRPGPRPGTRTPAPRGGSCPRNAAGRPPSRSPARASTPPPAKAPTARPQPDTASAHQAAGQPPEPEHGPGHPRPAPGRPPRPSPPAGPARLPRQARALSRTSPARPPRTYLTVRYAPARDPGPRASPARSPLRRQARAAAGRRARRDPGHRAPRPPPPAPVPGPSPAQAPPRTSPTPDRHRATAAAPRQTAATKLRPGQPRDRRTQPTRVTRTVEPQQPPARAANQPGPLTRPAATTAAATAAAAA